LVLVRISMALSNAERQRLYIQRLKAKAVVSNDKPPEARQGVSNGDDMRGMLVAHLRTMSPTDAYLFITAALSDLGVDWTILPDCSVCLPDRPPPPPEKPDPVALKALRKRANRLGYRVHRRKDRYEIEPADGSGGGHRARSIANAHLALDLIDGTFSISG
jgi:hypothetical protein